MHGHDTCARKQKDKMMVREDRRAREGMRARGDRRASEGEGMGARDARKSRDDIG